MVVFYDTANVTFYDTADVLWWKELEKVPYQPNYQRAPVLAQ